MATYNGEKYIAKQLESIFKQTREPDEIIISDDGSSDSTIKIIKECTLKNNFNNLKIIAGPRTGIRDNFYNAIDNATGEIVFISDQDDIWALNKIEKMSQIFKNEDVLTVTCHRSLIDENDKKISGYPDFVVYPGVCKNQYRKIEIQEEMKYFESSGLCLAFRKSLFQEVRKLVCDNNLEYDLPFALVSSTRNGNYSINDKLVFHRIHTENASAPINTLSGRVGKIEHQIEGHSNKVKMMEAILEKYREDILLDEKKEIEHAIVLHKRCVELIRKRNLLGLIVLILKPNKIINKWNVVADILSII
jgi:glycosyltransferase involved in cell wall biosynthesis